LTRIQQIGLSVAILCILGALTVGIYGRSHPSTEAPSSPVYTPPTTTSAPATIVVEVAGAVTRPSVYTLPRGARVQNAIEAAGGLLAGADSHRVNLAAPLEDGQKVDVPFLTAAAPAPPAGAQTSAGPTNLNTATAEELEPLPGIGPVLAKNIVDYRQRSGPFQSVDDLHAVPGIGPKRIEQIRSRVTVR
jgi:competence protein ComEA